ncbi:MAG: YHS domain-containing protein [Phycisphaerales bacterium]|nr:YHS domain-containing protein [Phycisphaerales bacterium]
MVGIVWFVLFVYAFYLLMRYTRDGGLKSRGAALPRVARLGPAPACASAEVLTDTVGPIVDPVCKKQINFNTVYASAIENKESYLFCSAACLHKFKANPSAYVTETVLGRT